MKAIWKNVKLMGTSARASLTLFELGAGEALLTYEQDALMALERNVPLDIVVPERTIVAQHYAVVVADNLTWRERPIAEAFIQFMVSDEGQQLFSQYAGLSHLLREIISGQPVQVGCRDTRLFHRPLPGQEPSD